MSIKIENTKVMGWEAVIRGMRNPLNSWDKSDSLFNIGHHGSKDIDTLVPYRTGYNINGEEYAACADWTDDYAIGKNDLDLMMRLAKAGSEHAKYRRMIVVYADITAPLYWWKEADTYRMGVEKNSCSTMHKIAAKEFTLEDFSCEHLIRRDDDYWDWDIAAGPESVSAPLDILKITIDALNTYREKYLETKDKKYWWQMIQLLPSSYNQRRTLCLNYEVLANIYRQRKGHKLDEWETFRSWIRGLPYNEIITLKEM